jgi:hypothetical protein
MKPSTTYKIEPQTGTGLALKRGQLLRIIDPEGEQVADLMAFNRLDITERLSSGRSIDYNGTIYLTREHVLYSNKSRPMFTIIEDTVGRHGFLFESCSKEMFRLQYDFDDDHPNCLDNLTTSLAQFNVEPSMITTPFNVFLNVEIRSDGGLTIHPPLTGPGDHITLRAEMDLVIGITACAAGLCNNYRCTAINVEVFGRK